MNQALLTGDWAAMIHIPPYGFLLLALPLIGLLALKLGGAKRPDTRRKGEAWIPTGQYDEDGLPLMARENSAPVDARMRAAMAAYDSKGRR